MALPADEKFQGMTACFPLINLYGYDRGEEPHRIVFPGKIAPVVQDRRARFSGETPA